MFFIWEDQGGSILSLFVHLHGLAYWISSLGSHRHLGPMEMRQRVKMFQLGKRKERTSLDDTGTSSVLPGKVW